MSKSPEITEISNTRGIIFYNDWGRKSQSALPLTIISAKKPIFSFKLKSWSNSLHFTGGMFHNNRYSHSWQIRVCRTFPVAVTTCHTSTCLTSPTWLTKPCVFWGAAANCYRDWTWQCAQISRSEYYLLIFDWSIFNDRTRMRSERIVKNETLILNKALRPNNYIYEMHKNAYVMTQMIR